MKSASKFVLAPPGFLDEGDERFERSGFLVFGDFEAGVKEKQSGISVDRMPGTQTSLLGAVN